MTSKCWNSTPQNTIEYIHMHISTHSPHLLKFLRTNAFHFVHIINISWPIITLQFWVCKANIWVKHIIWYNLYQSCTDMSHVTYVEYQVLTLTVSGVNQVHSTPHYMKISRPKFDPDLKSDELPPSLLSESFFLSWLFSFCWTSIFFKLSFNWP